MNLNILSFKTKNNNYIFDGNTSNIIAVDGVTEFIIKNFDKKQETIYQALNNLDFNIFKRKYSYVEKLFAQGMFQKYNKKNASINVREAFHNAPTMSLILVLTGKCNLRCEYCVYNDKYPKEINYDDTDMDFETAKIAIDQYFGLFAERRKRGFFKIPSVLFYGGEPLLHKDLIRQVVEYIEKKKYICNYYMTTNGLLLDKEFALFCVNKDFRLTFSLDGYQYNHDRNRVTINKEPTFELAVYNIFQYQKIKSENNKKLLISFNCCYDDYTDIEQCVNFFISNSKKLLPYYVVYSYISPYDTTYYDWLKENENLIKGTRTTFVESFNRVRSRFLRGEYNSEGERPAVQNLMLGAYAIAIRDKNEKNALNNSCVPLSKLAVYPDGTYALCEKMNKKFPIGSVNTGIDYERMQEIADMLKNALESNKCSDCPVKRICNVCFQFLEKDGQINADYCSRERRVSKQMLIDYCSMREENPEVMNYFSQIEETSDIINILS